MLLTHAVIDGECDFVELFRNLLPGGHVAVMATPTDLPDKGLALRLAGFEVRDTVAHITTGIEWGVIARKPLEGTVANNVLRHGVGGLNIDACRVAMSDADREAAKVPMAEWSRSGTTGATDSRNGDTFTPAPAGRFPANVVLDEHAAAELDQQSGVKSPSRRAASKDYEFRRTVYGAVKATQAGDEWGYTDSGGASRFFHTMTRNQFKQHMQQLIDPDFNALRREN